MSYEQAKQLENQIADILVANPTCPLYILRGESYYLLPAPQIILIPSMGRWRYYKYFYKDIDLLAIWRQGALKYNPGKDVVLGDALWLELQTLNPPAIWWNRLACADHIPSRPFLPGLGVINDYDTETHGDWLFYLRQLKQRSIYE